MSITGRSVTMFLVGLGVGCAVALVFAPKSGEEAREWISDTAGKNGKFLRRKGQQSIDHLQDTVAIGGEKVSQILKSSKDALGGVSAKLD